MSESSDLVLGLNDSRWPLAPEATPEATRLHMCCRFFCSYLLSPGNPACVFNCSPKNQDVLSAVRSSDSMTIATHTFQTCLL
jgi:hypothetical protein